MKHFLVIGLVIGCLATLHSVIPEEVAELSAQSTERGTTCYEQYTSVVAKLLADQKSRHHYLTLNKILCKSSKVRELGDANFLWQWYTVFDAKRSLNDGGEQTWYNLDNAWSEYKQAWLTLSLKTPVGSAIDAFTTLVWSFEENFPSKWAAPKTECP